jgi:hypothetical protein
VRFVVENINPLVHQYRIMQSLTTYTEPAIADFAKLALGFPVEKPQEPQAKKGEEVTAGLKFLYGKAVTGSAGCPAEDKALVTKADPLANELEEEATALASYGGRIVGRIGDAGARAGEMERSARPLRSDVGGATFTEGELLGAVDSLYKLLSTYVMRADSTQTRLADSVAAYNSHLGIYSRRVDTLVNTLPSCRTFSERRAEAFRWSIDTAVYRGAGKRLADHVAAVKTEIGALQRIHTNTALLHIDLQFGDYEYPTTLELRVQQSPAGPDTVWRTIANPRLNFGGRRRFALGAGLFGSRIGTADFSAVKRFQSPGDTIAVNVIVETQRTATQVGPALALSARIMELPWSVPDGVHLVVASAARTEQNKLTLDFFVGAGLSGMDERAFVVAGWASGQERTLAGGFQEGERLPNTQTVVPTHTSRRGALGVLVTFRLY